MQWSQLLLHGAGEQQSNSNATDDNIRTQQETGQDTKLLVGLV